MSGTESKGMFIWGALRPLQWRLNGIGKRSHIGNHPRQSGNELIARL